MIDTRMQINVICDKCGATEEFEAVVPRKDNIAKPENDIWDIEDRWCSEGFSNKNNKGDLI